MMKMNEIVVVEGRDDTAAVKKAVACITVETHGYGIRKETWDLLDQGYQGPGLVIFTDPDHAGEQLRRRLTQKYPEAKQAYLDWEDARKEEDIGVENASPEKIREALKKALRWEDSEREDRNPFTMEILLAENLSGCSQAALRRRALGKILGIGYGNSHRFLEKLNGFHIQKEEFYEALRTIQHQEDSSGK